MKTTDYIEVSQTIPSNLLDSEYTRNYLMSRAVQAVVDKMFQDNEIMFTTIVTPNEDGSYTQKIQVHKV